ncbi:MAG TPA: hypothetical protein VF815_12100 [Myxococcaceae bacterium]
MPVRKIKLEIHQTYSLDEEKQPWVVFAVLPPPDGKDAPGSEGISFKLKFSAKERKVVPPELQVFPLPDAEHPALWLVMVVSRELTGTVTIDGTWKNAEGDAYQFSRDFNAGTPVNKQVGLGLTPMPFRLSKLLLAPLLNVEAARMKRTEGESHAQCVSAILSHVHERLVKGLGEMWAQGGLYACKDGKPLCDWELEGLSDKEVQEAWVQALLEQIVYSCYAGAGNYMFSRHKEVPTRKVLIQHQRDAGFLDDCQDALNASEPCHPLMFACQQLCTWVLFTLFHGTRPEAAKKLAADPLDSSFDEVSRDFEKRYDGVAVRSASALETNKFLVPGACFYRSTLRHVGILVRTYDSTVIQLLDTGGWNFDFDMPEGSGTHDTSVKTALTYDCQQIIAPKEISPNDYRTAAGRLRRSRPLGVARLAIFERTTRAHVWISPFLPMHEGEGEQLRGYSHSRLIASLRGCPHSDRYIVKWFVWAPNQIGGPKGATDDERKANSHVRYVIMNGRKPDKDNLWWWQEPKTSGRPKVEIAPLLAVEVSATGVPNVTNRTKQSEQTSFPGFINGTQPFTAQVEIRPPQPGQPLPDTAIPANEVPVYFGGSKPSA